MSQGIFVISLLISSLGHCLFTFFPFNNRTFLQVLSWHMCSQLETIFLSPLHRQLCPCLQIWTDKMLSLVLPPFSLVRIGKMATSIGAMLKAMEDGRANPPSWMPVWSNRSALLTYLRLLLLFGPLCKREIHVISIKPLYFVVFCDNSLACTILVL